LNHMNTWTKGCKNARMQDAECWGLRLRLARETPEQRALRERRARQAQERARMLEERRLLIRITDAITASALQHGLSKIGWYGARCTAIYMLDPTISLALIVVVLALIERIEVRVQILDIMVLYAADKERSCLMK
jgi:hypothetical protein